MAPFIWNGPIEVPGPNFPVGLVFDLIGFLLQLFGLGSADQQLIISALNNTWENLVTSGTFIYNAVGFLSRFLEKLIKILVAGITHIISDLLHGHLLQALKDIVKLFHDLQALFGPIIQFLNRIRAWYYKYIYRWQHLAIQIISTIRVFLQIFRLLGAKWAAKLDADLQKIQGYITESITAVVGTLNTISSILGLVVDPGMIIRTSAFGGTLWNNLGLVKQSAGYGSQRPLYPDEKQTETDMHNSVYGNDPQVTFGADGTAHFDPALTLVDQSMTQQARSLGIQP